MASDRPKRQTLAAVIVVALLAASPLVGTVVVGDFPAEVGGIVAPAGDDTESSSGNRNASLRFRPAARDVGFNYTYAGDGTFQGRRKLATNAGVYVSDVDNDGWPDVLAVGGPSPILFENTGGEFRRSDRLPHIDAAISAALFLDYDADGWEDLLLLTTTGDALLFANRNGSFHRRDTRIGASLTEPIGATAGDYNGDGCLDLFVIQHGDWSERVPLGFRTYSAPVNDDNGVPNRLFRGTCSGFARVNASAIRGARWSLAASFVDLTGDGRPDIHVANDFNHDVVYLNRGNGTFEQVVLGEATNRNGMASEVADVTGDGRPDVFVTNIFYPPVVAEEVITNDTLMEKAAGNNLLVNRGNGTFVDRAGRYGVAEGGWGWAAAIADLDNDGDRDLVHATQTIRFSTELTRKRATMVHAKFPVFRYPAVRERAGGTFEPVAPIPAGFEPMDSRGIARLDYDRDGDLDLVFATRSRYRLYENLADDGHALEIIVRGRTAARAIGARVWVTTDRGVRSRLVTTRADFLSQDSRTIHVGLGNDTRVDVRVVWPDGTERRFHDVRAGQLLVVTPDGIREAIDLSRRR